MEEHGRSAGGTPLYGLLHSSPGSASGPRHREHIGVAIASFFFVCFVMHHF